MKSNIPSINTMKRDEGYSRNAPCALHLISTFLFSQMISFVIVLFQ